MLNGNLTKLVERVEPKETTAVEHGTLRRRIVVGALEDGKDDESTETCDYEAH